MRRRRATKESQLADLFELKRELVTMRKMVTPQRDMVSTMMTFQLRPRQGPGEGTGLTLPLGSLVSAGKGRSVTKWSHVPAVARPLPEPEPQAVLAPLTSAAIFMVLTIDPGGEETVRDLLA